MKVNLVRHGLVLVVCLVFALAYAKDYDDPTGEDNTWHGTGNDDTMNAGEGDDNLFGKNGEDVLNGGKDKDDIVGGEDDDQMDGGEDDDTFTWEPGDANPFNEGDEHANGGTGSDKAIFLYDLTGIICQQQNGVFEVTDPGGHGNRRPPGGKIILSNIEQICHLPAGATVPVPLNLQNIPPCPPQQ